MSDKSIKYTMKYSSILSHTLEQKYLNIEKMGYINNTQHLLGLSHSFINNDIFLLEKDNYKYSLKNKKLLSDDIKSPIFTLNKNDYVSLSSILDKNTKNNNTSLYLKNILGIPNMFSLIMGSIVSHPRLFSLSDYGHLENFSNKIFYVDYPDYFRYEYYDFLNKNNGYSTYNYLKDLFTTRESYRVPEVYKYSSSKKLFNNSFQALINMSSITSNKNIKNINMQTILNKKYVDFHRITGTKFDRFSLFTINDIIYSTIEYQYREKINNPADRYQYLEIKSSSNNRIFKIYNWYFDNYPKTFKTNKYGYSQMLPEIFNNEFIDIKNIEPTLWNKAAFYPYTLGKHYDHYHYNNNLSVKHYYSDSNKNIKLRNNKIVDLYFSFRRSYLDYALFEYKTNKYKTKNFTLKAFTIKPYKLLFTKDWVENLQIEFVDIHSYSAAEKGSYDENTIRPIVENEGYDYTSLSDGTLMYYYDSTKPFGDCVTNVYIVEYGFVRGG